MFEKIDNVSEIKDISLQEKKINMIIQVMVDAYLKKIHMPTMKEILAEQNIELKSGVLYNYHIVIIQNIFMEELEVMGYILANEVSKNGETFEPGKLSNYEMKLLNNKIKFIDCLLSNIEQKIEKN